MIPMGGQHHQRPERSRAAAEEHLDPGMELLDQGGARQPGLTSRQLHPPRRAGCSRLVLGCQVSVQDGPVPAQPGRHVGELLCHVAGLTSARRQDGHLAQKVIHGLTGGFELLSADAMPHGKRQGRRTALSLERVDNAQTIHKGGGHDLDLGILPAHLHLDSWLLHGRFCDRITRLGLGGCELRQQVRVRVQVCSYSRWQERSPTRRGLPHKCGGEVGELPVNEVDLEAKLHTDSLDVSVIHWRLEELVGVALVRVHAVKTPLHDEPGQLCHHLLSPGVLDPLEDVVAADPQELGALWILPPQGPKHHRIGLAGLLLDGAHLHVGALHSEPAHCHTVLKGEQVRLRRVLEDRNHHHLVDGLGLLRPNGQQHVPEVDGVVGAAHDADDQGLVIGDLALGQCHR
mmetsp:Transcript_92198/g.269781  ORF Transcript_92198/g.269781 Transcript_92198/m.269781 type:complete len:402 (-) Transcript_92198:132-1337(-)